MSKENWGVPEFKGIQNTIDKLQECLTELNKVQSEQMNKRLKRLQKTAEEAAKIMRDKGNVD
jgi:hypothetical protein